MKLQIKKEKEGKNNFFGVVLLCSLLMAVWALLILASIAAFSDSIASAKKINETHVSIALPESVAVVNLANSAEAAVVLIGSLAVIFIIGWQVGREKKLQKAGIAVLIYIAVFILLYYLVFLFLKKPFLLPNI